MLRRWYLGNTTVAYVRQPLHTRGRLVHTINSGINEPAVKDGIYSGDQACELARSLARLMTTGALTIATINTLPPQAKAQEENGATSPALSVPARPVLRTDAAPTFDIKIIASIASDYNFRGYTLSDHRPSISTNLEATYNIFFRRRKRGVRACTDGLPTPDD